MCDFLHLNWLYPSLDRSFWNTEKNWVFISTPNHYFRKLTIQIVNLRNLGMVQNINNYYANFISLSTFNLRCMCSKTIFINVSSPAEFLCYTRECSKNNLMSSFHCHLNPIPLMPQWLGYWLFSLHLPGFVLMLHGEQIWKNRMRMADREDMLQQTHVF